MVAPRSVYLHWPFCPYKCHFCPFVALASHDQYMEQYHTTLCKEIEQFGIDWKSPLVLDTIFIGGGTPSTYPPGLLLDMFGTLRKVFSFNSFTEVTIEVNPGTVNQEKLEVWKTVGINRLSIGVQSLNDSVLKQLNRHQKAASVFQLLESAANLFDNISVDLILGLPGVSIEEWKMLLEKIVLWPIKHVSVYFLTVHEDTPLYFKIKSNRITLPPDRHIIDLYYWTIEYLIAHGFEQYELSNFAKQGYESRHNTVYWERKPYKAFGLGACSFDGTERFQNEKNIISYMEKIQKGSSAIIFKEKLTQEQIYLERLMLGLRRKVGVIRKDFIQSLSPHQYTLYEKIESMLWHERLIVIENGRIILTKKGLVVENEVIAQIMRAIEQTEVH